MVAAPRWSGSSSAISINSPAAPMLRSVSLLVPLGDNPVPLSIMATCCSAVGGGECAHSYIMDIGNEINVQCEWHKPLDIPMRSGDWRLI